MANTDSSFGLRAVRTLSGADPNGLVTTMVVPASDGSALFIGSPVKLAGAEDTDDRLPTVILAGAGDRVFGVVQGFERDPGDLMQKHRTASTKRLVRIIPATPDVIFECQADAAMTAGDMGALFDLTAESGTAATGRSTVEVDIATASAVSGQVQVIGMARGPDDEFDTAAAGTNLHVIFNESDFVQEAGV